MWYKKKTIYKSDFWNHSSSNKLLPEHSIPVWDKVWRAEDICRVEGNSQFTTRDFTKLHWGRNEKCYPLNKHTVSIPRDISCWRTDHIHCISDFISQKFLWKVPQKELADQDLSFCPSSDFIFFPSCKRNRRGHFYCQPVNQNCSCSYTGGHPWECSRSGWMGHWATWFSVRYPWPWQGTWN